MLEVEVAGSDRHEPSVRHLVAELLPEPVIAPAIMLLATLATELCWCFFRQPPPPPPPSVLVIHLKDMDIPEPATSMK